MLSKFRCTQAHERSNGADITQSREEWIAGGSRRSLPGFPHVVFVRHDGPSTGVPVTLLHGFPTSSHDWAAVVPQLVGAGFRVTTADFVGFGESDKPYPHAYSILEQADLVEAVWEVDGHDTTAVVAHDYAVSVAQELLARTPDRVTCMTWLNGGIWPDLHHPILSRNSSPDLPERNWQSRWTRRSSSPSSIASSVNAPCQVQCCTTCGSAHGHVTD